MTVIAGLSPSISVSMTPLPSVPQLEKLWRELESRASGSFFTSWSWIGAWLTTYASEANAHSLLQLLVGTCDGRIVALGIVCRSARRQFFGAIGNSVLLHQTGRRDDDSAYIEYNSFLVDRDFTQQASGALLKFVTQADVFKKGAWAWREFKIAGADGVMLDAIQQQGLAYRATQHSDCPWVDLHKIAPNMGGYIENLSSNTRSQLRRSMRLIEADGPLVLSLAKTRLEAKSFMAELQTFHEMTWRRRDGGRGAFSSPCFAQFTDALIDAGHCAGNVDLLRISAGGKSVGVLLNFVYGGHVYAYQSGFSYQADNRLKPGLVSHALAIDHYRSCKHRGYHFMAGEGRYKSSLSQATEALTWLVLRRAGPLSLLEDALRFFKTRVTHILSGSHS